MNLVSISCHLRDRVKFCVWESGSSLLQSLLQLPRALLQGFLQPPRQLLLGYCRGVLARSSACATCSMPRSMWVPTAQSVLTSGWLYNKKFPLNELCLLAIIFNRALRLVVNKPCYWLNWITWFILANIRVRLCILQVERLLINTK